VLLQLSICTFVTTATLIETLQSHFDRDRYLVTYCSTAKEFLAYIEQHKQHLDCLVLEENSQFGDLAHQLHQSKALLPAVLLLPSGTSCDVDGGCEIAYHDAEVYLSVDRIAQLLEAIDRAIDRFLQLPPPERSIDTRPSESTSPVSAETFLMEQQQRLADKLRERLGYLGVYYKRNPQRFLRNLPREERQKLIQQIQHLYHDIVLNYFFQNASLNQQIDEFVNLAFFADISVTYIVEIHMELMDEFSNQLKLEGRSEEILLDYRLTLIDVIAHLCEMYRRSIPRDS